MTLPTYLNPLFSSARSLRRTHLFRTLLSALLFIGFGQLHAAAPANDNQANAATLSGISASASVNNSEATAQSGDYGKNTVWWKWTAPNHGTVSLDTINSSSTYIQLAVYLIEGDGTNRGLIYLSGSSSSLKPKCSLPVSSGTRLLFSVGIDRSSPASYTGTVRMALNLNTGDSIASTPFAHGATLNNNQFANRISLAGNTVSGISYTNQATTEAGEPSASGYKTAWWTYRPASKGVLTITTTGTNFNSKRLAVYLGSQVGSLRLITSGLSHYSTVSLSLPVTPNTDYQISIGGDTSSDYGGGIVNVSLNTEALGDLNYPHPATMANDNFSGRLLITEKTAGAMLYNATGSVEAGEPGSTGYRTFWWTYRPQANGRLSITTEGSSFYHPRVTVYQGTSLSNLRGVIAQEKYNSAVSFDFPVTANTDYIVCYGVYNSSSAGLGLLGFALDTEGDISQLSLPLAASTQNDHFSNRITIPGNNVSVIGYNAAASREALEPAAARERTLWWSWTASRTGTVILDFTGTSTQTSVNISVWQGNELSSLAQTDLVSHGGWQVGFQATAGQTYHFATGSTSANYGGPVVMTVKGPGGSTPTPDPTDKPVIQPVSVPDWYVGQTVTDFRITVTHGATKFKVTGLPPGVKFDAKTGQFTGRPTKARIVKKEVVPYMVTITATNAAGTGEPYTFEWMVEPLSESVLGVFYGIVERDENLNGRMDLEQGLGGFVQAKVTGSGAVSGSLKMAGINMPFRGGMEPQPDGSLVLTTELKRKKPLDPLDLSLVIATDGTLSGYVTDGAASAELDGWKMHANPDRAGSYNVAVDSGRTYLTRPNGSGFAVLKVSAKGTVTMKGKLADGTALTASSALAANGKFPWHQMLYQNTGSVQGVLTFGGDFITGSADWNKGAQVKKSSNYQDGFTLHTLAVAGGRYVKPVKGEAVLDLPSSLLIKLVDGGLEDPYLWLPVTLTDKNTLVAAAESAGLKVKLAATTGLFTGTFMVADLEGGKPRKMVIAGALIPGEAAGMGYFLLPSSSDKGASLLSGQVVLEVE